MVMTGGAGGGRRVRALVTWKRTAWKYNTNVRKKWIHSEHIILKIYVTAAVSGTEYSKTSEQVDRWRSTAER